MVLRRLFLVRLSLMPVAAVAAQLLGQLLPLVALEAEALEEGAHRPLLTLPLEQQIEAGAEVEAQQGH
jgi:hypothetical protein